MATHKPGRRNGAGRPVEGRLGAVQTAARNFLAEAMQAREVRLTRITPSGDLAEGWDVEAEILIPDLAIKRLRLPLRQEILEARCCTVHLDGALAVKSYEITDELER